MITDRYTYTCIVEKPIFRAFNTYLTVPVPCSTSKISRLGVVEGRELTNAVNEGVAFEAGSAGAVTVIGFAEVLHGHANLLELTAGEAEALEDEALGALEADLVVPVPLGTAEVERGGCVGGGEDAGAVHQVVALEAGKAEAVGVVSAALVADGHTDLFGVEDPVLGTLKADLVVPVPLGAAGVRGLGAVEGRELTNAVDEGVAFEAGSAGTVGVVGFAEVLHGHANFLKLTAGEAEALEDEALGALEADLIVPVPLGAAEVERGCCVGGGEDAGSLNQVVAFEAGQTLSVDGVVGFALVRDGHADFGRVEGPTI